MEVWPVVQGSRESRTVPVTDSSGAVIAYAGTETLSAVLWAGNDQPPLLTLSDAWLNAGLGTTTVELTEAQSTGLAVGQYQLVCSVTDDAGTWVYFRAVIAILPAPAAAVTRPTYITVADLRKVCAWIEDIQDPDTQEFGFLDQCADARDWLDECILRAYRGGNINLLGYHGLALDAWYTGGARRTALTNIWLKEQLAANTLLITPRIRRVLALYACYLIFDSQVNRGKEYQALAAKFQYQAQALLSSTVCELNLNGDGVTPNLPITMSATNTLMG